MNDAEDRQADHSLNDDSVHPHDSEQGGLLDSLMYGLTLPERTARSVAAAAAGMVENTSSMLLPAAFRSSRSYRVFIQESLDIVKHDVGGVRRDEPIADTGDEPPEDSTIAQKAIGGMLDFAGGATLHMSPLLVLAVLGDVCHGTNEYLRKLSEELEKEGVIDKASSIHHVSDLLDALTKTSERAGKTMETPPVNPTMIRQTIREIADDVTEVDPRKLLPKSELQNMWQEMEDVASASSVSLWDVATTVTLHSMNRLQLTTKGTLTSVRVVGNLLDQHLFDHYEQSIATIRKEGITEVLRQAAEPYLDAIWDNFSSQRETWTAEILSGRAIAQAWTSICGIWSDEEDAQSSD
ncbi:MAG: hypothetical protein AAF664_08420 [Planctomycetota bacterium]